MTVNGAAATVETGAKGGPSFTYTYLVPENASLGPATVEIKGVDLAGNLGVLTDTTALTIVAPVPVYHWPTFILLAATAAVCLRRRKR